jgi:alpha-D-ribose 1-methylphosphonate 5-triphosphate synthase subunit PhnG
LIELAERILDELDDVVAGSTCVGTYVLQVREPVEGIRFVLSDVLVTEGRAQSGNKEGWGIRLGTDPEAAMAAAVCDLVAETGHPWSEKVEGLCSITSRWLEDAANHAWSEVAATEVVFEELDR